MNRLKDKVILITGGNSGIGRATAIRAAREGARVAIGARDASRGLEVVHEIEASGGAAIFVPTDMAQTADIAALVQTTVATFGRLDCVFNNVAEIGRPAETHELLEEDFDHTVAVNLKGGVVLHET
jgi:NAD(P)-dependent dehydrogenase (short-subunit alcohol dehydrogenase family)